MSNNPYPGMNYQMGTIDDYAEFLAGKILTGNARIALDEQITLYVEDFGSIVIQKIAMEMIS